jgi:hypothetical protein
MMNENSPICARLIPACTDVRVPFPVRNAAEDTVTILPPTTSTVNAITAPQWATMTLGSSNIPTETKNTAANMSRTGSTSRSSRWRAPESPASDPARKAPSATE